MIDGNAMTTIAAIYAVGVVIPGPNFVAVAHSAMRAGRGHALAMVAGIVMVNVGWAACALLGVATVFAVFPGVALAVKIAGALYLMWFGWRIAIARDRSTGLPERPRSRLGAFRSGVAVNLLNPKSVAYFAAAFASSAPAAANGATLLGMLSTVAAIGLCWYGTVALVLSTPRIAAAFRRARRTFDLLCGGAMMALGLRQLYTLRPA